MQTRLPPARHRKLRRVSEFRNSEAGGSLCPSAIGSASGECRAGSGISGQVNADYEDLEYKELN